MVSDSPRLTMFPVNWLVWISRMFLSGDLWLGADLCCAPAMFQVETYQQQWIRIYFLCCYFSILLIWHSAVWYSNIHFLSVSFQKGEKLKKMITAKACPHFPLQSFWYLILVLTWVTNSRAPRDLSSETTAKKNMRGKKTLFFKIHFPNHTYTWWADQRITLSLFFILPTLSHHPVWFLRHHSNCLKWQAFIGFFDLRRSRK